MNEYLETEREIKGYVEIQYGKILKNRPIGISYTFLPQAPISYQENMFNQYSDEKISQNYASLENNYFLLDGSFALPYKPDDKETYYNTNSGYISNEIMEEYPLYIDYYQSEEKESIRGMTLYFKDNIPRNITLNASVYNSDKTFNFILENNEKSVVEFDFGDNYIIENMNFRFSNMEYEDRRLRISYIDFGLSDILSKENGNLINFNIVEQIGYLNTELPSNECNIEFYDEERKFDLNNPKGFANLLNNEVSVTPFIGILTNENGFKYTQIGRYVVDTWNNNNNSITLNCVDYLKFLKNTPSNYRMGSFWGSDDETSKLSELEYKIYDETGVSINLYLLKNKNIYYDDKYLETSNFFDYIQELLFYMIGVSTGSIVDNLKPSYAMQVESYLDYSRIPYKYELKKISSLLEEPKYETIDKIKSISITKYIGENLTNVKEHFKEADVLYRTSTENLKSSYENNKSVIAEFNGFHNVYVTSSTNEYEFNCVSNLEMTQFMPNNYKENPSEIIVYNMGDIELITSKYTEQINNEGKEIIIDNKFFKKYDGETNFDIDEICDYFSYLLQQSYKNYNVSIKYIGDPNIRPNMIVPIETQYGEKEIKVLKHTLTYNGGLTGTIEGVGD